MAEFKTTKGTRMDERDATVNRLLISDVEEAEVATTRIADDSSSLAEWLKYYIDIVGVTGNDPAFNRVKFKAFITKYQEQINTKYTDEMLGGNMEPVKKLDSVIRSVNLGWDLIASSEEEARNNLRRISKLVQMIHPTRRAQEDASYGTHFEGAIAPYTLTHQLAIPGGTPIFKVRFLNLIGSPIQSWGPAATSGQLGYITNVSYNFETDFGFFKSTLGGLEVYPKLIKFSCTFWPQNAHPPTFNNENVQFKKSRWWYWLNSPHGDKAHFSSNDIPEPAPAQAPPEEDLHTTGYNPTITAANQILQTDETPFLVHPRDPGGQPRRLDNPLNSQLASMRAQSQITKNQPTKATSTEHGVAARLGIINPGK